MDATPSDLQHLPVRVLIHIKKLDDCFGQFLVRVTCKCGTVREITPEALARLVLVSEPQGPCASDAPLAVRGEGG